MKHKLSKRMVVPVLYGLLAAWLLVGACAVVTLTCIGSCPLLVAMIGISVILLLALVPALRRTAVAYALALRYHKAEYFYDIGNGVAARQARKQYEKKARRAASVWIKRTLLQSPFNPLIIAFLALLLAGCKILHAVALVCLITVAVLIAVELAVFTMLFTAKRYCFDKYGNIRTV